jgi:hypothetical protein
MVGRLGVGALMAFVLVERRRRDPLAPLDLFTSGQFSAGHGLCLRDLPGVVLVGLGVALAGPPLTATVLDAAGGERAGVASALNNTAARVAGLLAVAGLPLATRLSGDAYRDAAKLTDAYRSVMWIAAAVCASGGPGRHPDSLWADDRADDGRLLSPGRAPASAAGCRSGAASGPLGSRAPPRSRDQTGSESGCVTLSSRRTSSAGTPTNSVPIFRRKVHRGASGGPTTPTATTVPGCASGSVPWITRAPITLVASMAGKATRRCDPRAACCGADDVGRRATRSRRLAIAPGSGFAMFSGPIRLYASTSSVSPAVSPAIVASG